MASKSDGLNLGGLIRRGRIARPRRVGVVGPFHAGKTVMLTSLISQIKHHTAGRLDVFGPDVGLAELASSADAMDALETRSGLAPFDYNTARDRLAHGGWPAKTVAASEYRSFIVRADDRWRMYDLSLIDWPGERLADLAMVGHGSFQRWSDAMLHALDLELFRPMAQPFLSAMNPTETDTLPDSSATENELAMTYRRVLSRFVDAALPFVTPSSFLVDIENRYATEQMGTSNPTWSVDELARLAIGTAPGEPFFPLSAAWRQTAPQMADRLTSRFESYVAQVVKPVADALNLCDHILLLVDVAHLLEAGPSGVEGTTRLFEELLGWINPGTTTTERTLDWMAWLAAGDSFRLGGVRQITVLGTQSDRIHADDRQAAEGLLHQLIEPLVRKYQVQKRLKMKYGIVAAVNATRSEPIGPDQRRKLTFQDSGASFEAAASTVPATWPDSWKAGDFAFPRPHPRLPMKRTQAPEQFGLGQVLQWILK
ncbi:MAG: YcjX family protein [Planctomycetota bacterium]